MGKHIGSMSVGGALRVVLFFARNPEEDLTTADVTLKFAIPAEHVRNALARAVANGLLRRNGGSTGGRGKMLVYSAGDMLLSLIGERRLVEDRRTHDRDSPDRRAAPSVMVMVLEACAPLGCAPLAGAAP